MMRHRQRQRQRERQRQHQLRRHDLTRRSSLANKNTIRNYNHDDRENMRIIVQDNSEDKYQKQQPLNLFDLP
jgi:hypothetical protein